jgi:endonuclease/exonuclease/phosphatase family metal-dependent hydrolase
MTQRIMPAPHTVSRRRFLGQAAIGLAVSQSQLAPAAQAAEGRSVRVLTYNIHWALGMDGKYDVRRIAEVIKAAKPDLVALQEVDVGVKRSARVHEVRLLAESTGLAGRFGPTQHFEGGLFGNAVLTGLPILDVEIHPLPYTEATPQLQTYPRGAIAVTVTAPDGKPLRFISTHFQHNVPEDRVAQAKATNELFAAEGDRLRTILAGDMNAKPDNEPIRVLLERWKQAGDEGLSPTVPVVNPTSRIDYVFYRNATDFRLKDARVIPEQMASDHRPVFAELELAGK